MYTYQDFIAEESTAVAINNAITQHLRSDLYKTARSADLYDKRQNETIMNFVKRLFDALGTPMDDFIASNNRLASGFFHRLNTQRCTYLLGNGVSFTEHVKVVKDQNGADVKTDTTKERLGDRFDQDLYSWAYYGLIHSVCFGYWNMDRLHVFPVTEFVPLYDEETSALRAGIRFWQIDKLKPMTAVLYEENGYSKYRTDTVGAGYDFKLVEDVKPYKLKVVQYTAGGEDVLGGENYSALPIIPLYGSRLHQSTLVGMREQIDSYDIIRSGFANDLQDCAQVYWIIENCGGMTDAALAKFRDRLKTMHIAVADTINSGVTPYTQEIPYQARKEYLDEIRAGIYEDFGGLDVHTIAAGSTNDHIDAAYQPLDEEADDFEYQVIEALMQLLDIIGIEDVPVFKRNRISNQKEQTEMILSAGEYLDTETVLRKLPFVTVDEVSMIMAALQTDAEERFEVIPAIEQEQ